MCLAIPFQLVQIEGNNAIGEAAGVQRKIRVDFIREPQVGDYVIVHAGFAIEKMNEQQALDKALADAGLGNESAAEAFVVGYQAGWDKALNLAISIENELNSDEPTDKEIETCARGFFEGTPGPTNWYAVSEVSKQAWLHAAKKALAAVNAMKTKEQQ